jgi:hypothetical protein
MLVTFAAGATRPSGSGVRQAGGRDRNELSDPLADPGRRRTQQFVDPCHRNILSRRRRFCPQQLRAMRKMGPPQARVEVAEKIAMHPLPRSRRQWIYFRPGQPGEGNILR